MKQLGKFFSLCLLLLLSACSSSLSDASGSISADTATLTNSGEWQISYYAERSKDETSDYSGYRFFFDDNGTFRAVTPANVTFTGSWKRTTDDGLPRLVISITGNEDLDELDDDWVLNSLSDSKIELEDDNTLSQEFLHFEKS